jgi:hypothetical protein
MLRFRSTESRSALLTRAGELGAVVCLSFGTTLAAILETSVDQRVRTWLLLGLLPAVVFYAGGHVSWMIGRAGLQDVVRFLGYAKRYVAKRLAKVAELGQKTCNVVRLCYSYAHRSIFDLSCLVIRSTAQLLLTMQSQAGSRSYETATLSRSGRQGRVVLR